MCVCECVCARACVCVCGLCCFSRLCGVRLSPYFSDMWFSGFSSLTLNAIAHSLWLSRSAALLAPDDLDITIHRMALSLELGKLEECSVLAKKAIETASPRLATLVDDGAPVGGGSPGTAAHALADQLGRAHELCVTPVGWVCARVCLFVCIGERVRGRCLSACMPAYVYVFVYVCVCVCLCVIPCARANM
jgi:hypothetical protein